MAADAEARLRYHFTGAVTAPVDPCIESTTEQCYIQDKGLDTARSVNFEVDGHDQSLIDLQECYIKTVIRVVKANGDELPALDLSDPATAPMVFLPANYGNALWGQVSIRLNNTPLPPGNDYTYTGVLIDYLGAAPEVREQVYKELDGCAEPTIRSSYYPQSFYYAADTYVEGRRLVAGSEPIEVYQRIHSDFLMTSSHLLPSRMRLGITLHRTKDEFVLGRLPRHEEKYKIEMQQVSLVVKRVTPTPEARSKLSEALESGGTLVYQRLHLIPHPCPSNSLVFSHYNCFNGVVPRRVFIAIVTQESYDGSLDRDPTFFESAGVSRVRVCRNGQEVMLEPYTSTWRYKPGAEEAEQSTVVWEDSKALGPYAGLNRVLESFASPRQRVGVSYKAFRNGATIWAVDLEHAEAAKLVHGSLDVHIDFAAQTPEPLIVLVMGEYPKTLYYNEDRNLVHGPPPFY